MASSTALDGLGAAALARPSRVAAATRFVRRQPVFVLCAAIMAAFIVVAACAPVIAPYPPNEQNLAASLAHPSAAHLLGTDEGGRDILSRTIFGARISLSIGFGSMLLGGALAAVAGGLSGYVGGAADTLIQRVVDAALAIPALILLMTVLSVVGASLAHVIAVLSVWAMVVGSRTIRSAVLAVKERPFVDSARSVGAGWLRIFCMHVLPNVVAPIMVVATLMFGYAILTAAALSFLGYGVAPPTATWGGMLSGNSRGLMVSAPWIGLAPGVALSVMVIAVNLLGDGLRDVLDPRLRMR